MKVLFLNAGNENGGGMHHILRVLCTLQKLYTDQFCLGVFEKKELYEQANKLGIPTYYFANSTKFNPQILRQLQAFIHREQITHVHTHGPRANVYMSFVKPFVKIPWIITLHSNPYCDFSNSFKGRLYTYLHTNALKKAHHIITVCDAFRPILHRLAIPEEKITTIRNGIAFQPENDDTPINEQKLRADYGFNKEHFILVQVARLEKVKDHQLAIEAVDTLIAQGNENLRLLFVGDGSLRADLQVIVQQKKLSPYIYFYGNVANVQPFYQLADAVLLTSTSESFPYVLLEAAREKKPLIATDVGDIAELIPSSKFGWLIEPGNRYSLQQAIREAMQMKKSGQLAQKGVALYAYAKEQFTLENCVQQMYDVYLRVQ